MSGIMAIVSLDGRPIPPDLPRAQLAAIAHRGEWEPRLWEAPGIALGHVNLPRTPEAEREFLPMSDRTGRYWLTWDGRLDNRDELGPKLGYDVNERAEKTDADYVLDAFIKWGDDCVRHLLGDWAVVVWDHEARRLFCAKDPVGYKQLFFRQRPGLLLVGSEPQQLFNGPHDRQSPDRHYTLRFLAGVMQTPGRTWLDGVSHLSGGEVLSASTQVVSTVTYWTQPHITKRSYKRPEQYVDEFVDTFERAVRARVRSNRPIGLYLSGGIDSSYVAAVAAKGGTTFTALTSYAPGTSRMDERRYASIVVSHLGIRQVETDIGDCWTISSDWLPDSCFDNPFHPAQGSNQVRMGMIARREGIGVVLGGEGGDEWSNGPENYLAHALSNGRFLTAWRLARLNGGRKSSLRRLAREARSELMLFPSLTKGSPDADSDFADEINILSHLHGSSGWSYRRYQQLQWDIYRQVNWLEPSWRDRHEASRNGFERRPPFFDLRVIELLASTPAWVKRFNGRRKDILREAEYRLLPAVIADRMDWGLYDELYFRGMEREVERVHKAVASVIAFTGRPPTSVADGALGDLQSRVNHDLYRTVTTGLWLSTMGVSAPAEKPSARCGSPNEQEINLYLRPERR